MIEYMCPKCREPMMSPDSVAGRVEDCPDCGTGVVVPIRSLAYGVQQGEVAKAPDSPAVHEPDAAPSKVAGVIVCVLVYPMLLLQTGGAFVLHVWAAYIVANHYDSLARGMIAFALPVAGGIWAIVVTLRSGSWLYVSLAGAWVIVSVGVGAFFQWADS